MKYIHGTTEFHIEEECVLSLGKFDGLHRGHETLLEHMMEQKNKGCATVLFTFAIPPRPGRINEVQKVLTTNEEKVAICEEQGIDYLIEYPFTKEVMTMEPEAFIEMLASSMALWLEQIFISDITAAEITICWKYMRRSCIMNLR